MQIFKEITDYNGLTRESTAKDLSLDTLFNLEKVDYVDVFKGLDAIIEHLDLPTTKYKRFYDKNGKISKNTKDCIYVYLSWIRRLHVEEEYAFISSNSFKKINRYYRDILKALKNGTEKGAIIEIDETYRFNSKSQQFPNKCKGYRLTRKYKTRKVDKKKLYLSRYDMFSSYEKQNLLDISKNDIGRMQIKAIQKTTLPTLEDITQKAKAMVGLVNNKGKIYVEKDVFCEEHGIEFKDFYDYTKDHVPIEPILKNYENVIEHGFRVPKASDKTYRVCDSIVQMPKFIRNEVLLDGEKIKEIDIQALHPNIIATLMKNECPDEIDMIEKYLDGDTHTKIANYLGLTRKEVKKEFLSYFNERNCNMVRYEVDKLFKDKLPQVRRWMRSLKTGNHRRMARWLGKNETTLMTNVVRLLDSVDIKCYVVYDAIYVAESNFEQAFDKMNYVIKELEMKTIAD